MAQRKTKWTEKTILRVTRESMRDDYCEKLVMALMEFFDIAKPSCGTPEAPYAMHVRAAICKVLDGKQMFAFPAISKQLGFSEQHSRAMGRGRFLPAVDPKIRQRVQDYVDDYLLAHPPRWPKLFLQLL